jgi:hypothetical protein
VQIGGSRRERSGAGDGQEGTELVQSHRVNLWL